MDGWSIQEHQTYLQYPGDQLRQKNEYTVLNIGTDTNESDLFKRGPAK